jgi:hypothetical protein
VPSIAKSRARIRTRLLLDKWRSQPPLQISSFDQRNSDRMFCESELAIESDWIASCCWVCSEGEEFSLACGRRPEGVMRSTRLPKYKLETGIAILNSRVSRFSTAWRCPVWQSPAIQVSTFHPGGDSEPTKGGTPQGRCPPMISRRDKSGPDCPSLCVTIWPVLVPPGKRSPGHFSGQMKTDLG